jgi:putative transcriptional regulator
MAKRSLESILAAVPDVDQAHLDATTEEDIRRHAREDGEDPDAPLDGYVLVPVPVDLRRSLDMTQEAFAAFLRVPVGTIRNWEQGRTPPDPAARTLLALVAADPKHASKILGWPVTGSPEERGRARRFA